MAACIAVAEYPGRVEDVFFNKGASEAGVYALQFYALGAPITITVDDQLPLAGYSDGSIRTLYAKIGPDKSIWGSIMEKAFSKFIGNYARTVGGFSVDAINTLTGSPYETLWHDYVTDSSEVWDLISTHDPDRGLLVGSTPCAGGSDDTTNDLGLVNCHAYVVLGHAVLTRNDQKLVKMRNPWAQEQYYGPYSDDAVNSADQLTAEDLTELGHTPGEDGVFYMREEDYFSFV